MAESNETVRPWDQQPGEPDMWYQRFALHYLSLSSTLRSILRAYKSHRSSELDMTALSEIAAAPPGWYDYSKAWHWKDRARAYDKVALDEWYENLDELKRKCKQDRIEAMQELLVVARRGIALQGDESLAKQTTAQLSQAEKVALRELREENEGASTHNVIDVNVVLKGLSPELQATLLAAIKLAQG